MWLIIFVLAPCFAVHVINSNNDIMNTTNTQLNDTAPTVVTSSQPPETRATFEPTESAISSTKETFNTSGTLTTSVSATSVYQSTVKEYASTKSFEKNARKQHLNTSSSALSGAGVVAGSGAYSGRFQERLAAIECDLPLLPRESRLWRGNETHELKLPVTECGGGAAGSGEECPPVVVSWEGAADIQSGDILIVRIADSSLLDVFGPIAAGRPNGTHHTNSSQVDGERLTVQLTYVSSFYSGTTLCLVHRTLPQPAVYQVTRQGHEHCDVSDGMLLDITPLDDQGDKLITLYDKDLTEGVNFLIVVSESWRSQCVRLKVTVKSDNCGDSQDCSGKGVCYTNVSMEGYECQCCHGYVGPHCEERDACHPTPCMNNGICVKTTQLNDASYRCLCPYGFTGRKCEKDPCASSPCLNGGSCMSMVINNSTSYRCACADGWMGSRCQLPISGNVCVSNPCVNGICVEHDDDTDGRKYRCFCQPGYTGEQCDLEYNECESSPCANGGTCTDRVGRFECSCGRGYTGNTCQLKVDLCSPDPCPSSRYCVDRGNSYSCECPHGYIGEECRMPTTSPCDNNPCAHGGTCWSGVDTFYCSCRAEYTGRLCEETFVLESVVGSEAAIETHVQGEEDGGGGGGAVREVRLPLGLYHDRLHNVYIAAGTLGAAIAIVGVVVTACHCRVNKTYARLMSRLSRVAAPGAPHHWLHDKRAPPPSLAPFTPSHALDTTDMYYTLDFSDSQSSPLIQ